MAMRREQWTRIRSKIATETPRSTVRTDTLFVSPGGFFVPAELPADPFTQVTVRFSVEGREVVAHAEVRRTLTEKELGARGILHNQGGTELRIVRMEGDGSQILAEHIKKVVMESGGPG